MAVHVLLPRPVRVDHAVDQQRLVEAHRERGRVPHTQREEVLDLVGERRLAAAAPRALELPGQRERGRDVLLLGRVDLTDLIGRVAQRR